MGIAGAVAPGMIWLQKGAQLGGVGVKAGLGVETRQESVPTDQFITLPV